MKTGVVVRGFALLALKGVRIVWVASVSKSGNTWLRYLLYNALYGETKGEGEPEHAIPHLVDMPGAVENGTAGYTPAKGFLLVKTHALPWSSANWQRLLMPLSAGVLYVYRNPKDICLSQINHMRLRGERADATDLELAFEFLEGNLFPQEGQWPSHITAWMELNDIPILQICYEQMKTDTVSELSKILDFIGEENDVETLHRAVEQSSFTSMQKLEEVSGNALGYSKTGGDTKRRFINKGLSNQSLSRFGAEFTHEFARKFGGPMRDLGYSTEP